MYAVSKAVLEIKEFKKTNSNKKSVANNFLRFKYNFVSRNKQRQLDYGVVKGEECNQNDTLKPFIHPH